MEESAEASEFAAEAAYAESIVMSAMGDTEASIASLVRALEILPTYAPAALTLGSIEFQLGEVDKGQRRFLSLLELPDDSPDLPEIVDEAGNFLIGARRYSDGLELYEKAVARFPDVAVFHQGVACCAGNEGDFERAVKASEASLRLAPDDQELVNDLGWSLFEAGRVEEALQYLQRAVEMDPNDALAAENLRLCREAQRD